MANKPIYTITEKEAHQLMDWMGNNFIETDLTFYDGGEQATSLTTYYKALGYQGDAIKISREEAAEALISAAEILKARGEAGEFSKKMLEDKTTALKNLTNSVDFGLEWSGLTIVYWCVEVK